MNLPLFKLGWRSLWRIFLGFALLLTMYIAVIIPMFDPQIGGALAQLAQSMPELMAMFGMAGSGLTMTDFVATYLYGMLMPLFPMIFSIIAANRLVARHVDKGSMAYLLAAPVPRRRIVATQLAVLLSSLILLLAYCTGLCIAVCELSFPGQLETGPFLLMNLSLLGLHLALAGVCFFASCLCNETKTSLALGAGIPTVFYLIRMLANMGGRLDNLKYATVFSLFDAQGILSGQDGALWMIPLLFLLGAVLFGASFLCFQKRDIPV